MRKLLAVTILLSIFSASGFGEVRREPMSKKQVRGDLIYIVNEESPYTGMIFATHANGQLSNERHYKDGKIHGISKSWYENGQLEAEISNKDGKQDGILKEWYENGQLKAVTSLKDSKLDGVSKIWDEDGKLIREITYKDGVEVK